MPKKYLLLLIFSLVVLLLFNGLVSCNNKETGQKGLAIAEKLGSIIEEEIQDEYNPANALLVLPANPAPGERFSIVSTGGRNISKAKILVTGPAGAIESKNTKTGNELPGWRIDEFEAKSEGKYSVSVVLKGNELAKTNFEISVVKKDLPKGGVWKTTRGWDSQTETLYSAWINALFGGSSEQTSWAALHEATRDSNRNFLNNYLGLNEDDPAAKTTVLMEPDCADNPFFLRAYFAWKLGLPFGYHICDRGYVGKNPNTGRWITNENPTSKSNPVLAFNSFVRNIMDGVHSGTGRTALDNENADYYPVSLDRQSLRPGTVYADPYGHTFILVSRIEQTKDKPGVLLAVDAQPDNTIAIKRFWKGNFLFNTKEVVGEPGFKAFRPILFENGKVRLIKNEELNETSGFAAFSLQQKQMEMEVFYRTMEKVINPKPLDPEAALMDLIHALHEQLQVRVKSVANGEAWFKSNPGSVIPMPSNANGIFLAGGLWEDFSTPNRDLRLLIAMDAVLNFPNRVADSPKDFDVPKLSSPENIKSKLQEMLDKKTAELTISYMRTDGSLQELTIAEILKRRDAFEVAYNPNDCVEIRWGAPENSVERSTGKRHAPSNQQVTMQKVRTWFAQRLHPPT